MKRILTALACVAIANTAFAQASTSGAITNGTASTAQQQSTVQNAITLGGGGDSQVGYSGSYSVKSAPTVYAPALTASMTETCWGSISGAVSVMGLGVTGAATIKDYDCNRRLTAAVAGRMGRMDIAFNLMCQDDGFRSAAALTKEPCPSDAPVAKQGTEIISSKEAAKMATNMVASTAPVAVPTTAADASGQQHYTVADTSGNRSITQH